MHDTNSKIRVAKSFKDLEVYRVAFALAFEIFEITKRFPKEEVYSLTDQIRRSSRSIGGQIAESWAKRRYVKHFITKLTDADAEQMETQHWIDTALSCTYIDEATAGRLSGKCLEIGKMINSMIGKSHTVLQ